METLNPNVSGLTPAEQLVEKLERMEKAGMEKTKRWIPIWQDSLHYFFSDQLKNKRTHKDWDWIIINYIWPSAMQEIAKLSKNDIKGFAVPWEQSDVDYADAWESILEYLWKKGLSSGGMRIQQIRGILDKKLFGYSISKLYWEQKPRNGWDEQTKSWQGEVQHKLWHPAEFWASDEERIDDGACGSMRFVDLEWAISRWPQFKAQLESEAVTFKDAISGGYGGDYIRGQLASAGTYPSAGYGGIDKGLGANGPSELLNLILSSDRMSSSKMFGMDEDRKMVKISEQYFYDYREEMQQSVQEVPPEELLATGQAVQNQGLFYDTTLNQPITAENWPRRVAGQWSQPLYPYGRYVIRANKTILNPGEESNQDPASQRYNYSRWPYIVTPHYLLPHIWQGIDAVQMYKSAQDMINVTVSHLVNNLKQFGDPKIAIEDGAIAAPAGRTKAATRIAAGAGAIIRLVRGGLNRIKVLDPPPPSQGATQLYAIFSQEFKNLTGMQPPAMGEREPGEKTATEVQHLVLSAHDRIYLQSVMEEIWAKEVLCLSAEIAQKNYDVGRIIRIIGEDRQAGAIQITEQMKSLRFDVDIEIGTALPWDDQKRVSNYQMAYQILSNPVANPMTPEMLRVLEIPGWPKILEKYEAWQQFYQLYMLYESVKKGEIEPQEAVRVITQKAMQLYAQQQVNTAQPPPPEKGKQNAVR